MAPLDLSIRDAKAADAGTIARYNARLAEESEGMRLLPEIVGPGVEALLADPSRGRYWVAEADGRVVGQIMVTYEWSDWRNGSIWWIQSVYVAPEARRRGAYSALHRAVLDQARRAGDVCGVRLYVESANRAAQSTYERLGMHAARYRLYEQAVGPLAG